VPTGVGLEGIWTGTVVNVGVFFVLAAPLLAWVILRRTGLGFGIRTFGRNPDAARLAGFPLGRIVLAAFGLGGMFAGLAGATQVIGIDKVLSSSFSPGWGFTGIAVALTARLNPLWIPPAAFGFSILVVGGNSLPTSVGISTSTTLIVQALFVLLLLALWVIPPPFRRER
jgi:simple sugar transport system permease protein